MCASYALRAGPKSDTAGCDCLAHRLGNACESPTRPRAYPLDLTDEEWDEVKGMLPVLAWARGRGGRPENYCRRVILDEVHYVVDNG